MRNRLARAFTALLCLTGCVPTLRPANVNMRWAAYYQTKLPASAFAHCELVIFDRRYHPDFHALKKTTQVYAYVSIGEVYDDVPEKQTLENHHLLLKSQGNWKSHIVDITSPLWHKMVLEQVADAEKKGFHGVFLDTVDSPLHWSETADPDRQEAMQDAALDLIHEIHVQHPKLKLILNRGLGILPAAAPDLDFALAESIFAQPGDSSGQFMLQPASSYAQAVAQLHRATAFAPGLQILTLDYWNQDDVQGVQRIYAAQRAHGFIPYVTTPDLHQFTPEPAPAGRPIAVAEEPDA